MAMDCKGIQAAGTFLHTQNPLLSDHESLPCMHNVTSSKMSRAAKCRSL